MKIENGFTLLELLVTLAVAAIVLSLGVPAFRDVIMDNRLATEANGFVTSVNLARSSAVRFQRPATICSSNNYDAAVPSCSGANDWATGWIVWVDKDRDALTSADEIVAVHEPLNDTSTLTSTALDRLTYDARGFSMTGGDDLTLCDNRGGENGRVINVNNTGRTSVSTVVCP